MQGFYTMFKMNLKLLLRNKGYLAFLIILPFLSVILLNINNVNSMGGQENATKINELDKKSDTILNLVNSRLSVKVYDCSNSMLSDYIINELAKTGSYSISRYRGEAMDINEAREIALYSANHNVIGAVIYIPDTFEAEILEGKESNIVVFEATQDGRIDLLGSNLNSFLKSIYHYAPLAGFDRESLNSILETSVNNEITKKTVIIEVGDTLNLTTKQMGQSSAIAYSLSFLTIAFLFSGVFIASTVIEERQNRVYNRFVLSKASLVSYALTKLMMVFMTVLMQTGIIAIAIKLLVKTDYGISFASYLFLIFCLGLIFNSLSVVIGVLTNNVLSSNYIAFLIWSLSCLLAGLYFPLDGASKWWARASMLMPQRWVVKASEMLMVDKNGVFSMFLLVVISYLTVIISVGLIGIKVRRKE